MGTIENGSDVNLDFEEEDLSIIIYYDDIKLKSVLNAFSEEFIGFPKTEKIWCLKFRREIGTCFKLTIKI